MELPPSITLHPEDGDDLLTSVTIDENFLIPCQVGMIVLVTDGYRQSACHCLGWTAAVAHDNRNEEFFLPFTVKHSQGCECSSAVQVVLEVEIIAVAILRGDAEVKGWAILGGVLVHSSEEG